MTIEIVKGGDTPVTQFFSSSSTPDTDELYNSLLAENPGNYIYLEVMLQHTRELERERNELRAIVQQRLVAGATIHQNANDLVRKNERLESERDELIGVIKSLRKNAREDAARIDELEKALSYGKGGKTLLSKFLNAVKERGELREGAKLLIELLVRQIERPAYSVQEAVEKMILMDDAKKFINEV